MDLAEILLILLFLVFPLLQQLLQKRSPPPPPLDPEAEAGSSPMDIEARTEERPAGPAPAGGAGEPVEWEKWSADAAEALSRREVVTEEEASELTVLQSRLPAETVPEAVRVSSPVVSMESLRVERPAKPARAPLRARPAPAAVRTHHAPSLDSVLHGREQLRRAVILSEVLGPPKSFE